MFPGSPRAVLRLTQRHQSHELLLKIHDGALHQAPIGKSPQRILDIGTGTGIWAIDAADRYPSALVTGTDLSPIQPSWVPPNCKFEIDDAEREWTHPEVSARAHRGAGPC